MRVGRRRLPHTSCVIDNKSNKSPQFVRLQYSFKSMCKFVLFKLCLIVSGFMTFPMLLVGWSIKLHIYSMKGTNMCSFRKETAIYLRSFGKIMYSCACLCGCLALQSLFHSHLKPGKQLRTEHSWSRRQALLRPVALREIYSEHRVCNYWLCIVLQLPERCSPCRKKTKKQ